VHGAIYSGFGGSTDFVVGALHSPGQVAHPSARDELRAAGRELGFRL